MLLVCRSIKIQHIRESFQCNRKYESAECSKILILWNWNQKNDILHLIIVVKLLIFPACMRLCSI